MRLFNLLLLASTFCPLWRAWRANATTTLRPSLVWAALAWLAWLMAFNGDDPTQLWRYLALSLTGCAGVAVLGARRPGVGPWNFVVAGLLTVFLVPVARGFGEPRLEMAHLLILAGVLAMTLLNYLPTRLGAGVFLCGLGWALEWRRLGGAAEAYDEFGRLALALGPWIAWLLVAIRRTPEREVDQLWLDFRDRFGVVWGQRAREQFNRAAASAGWSVVLTWHGLEDTGQDQPDSADLVRTLKAVLKRFGPEVG